MTYTDNIKWLESLKSQIGQSQHQDLWHFEEIIDETIENLKPLAKPHGRLIDADDYLYSGDLIDEPTIIEAEVSE